MSDINPILSGIKYEMKRMADTMEQMCKTHAQVLTEEWLTKSEARAVLRISVRTLESLKSSKQLPYAKLNGLVYFKTVDIENLLNSNYVSTTTSTDNQQTFNTSSNVSTADYL